MAHFAKIENGIVTQVIVCDEQIAKTLPGVWVQTSYNTKSGEHLLGGEPLRKNYAGIGYTYDSVRDAFIPPQTYPSWKINEDTCQWEAPIPYPNDGKDYRWDEPTLSWIEVPPPTL